MDPRPDPLAALLAEHGHLTPSDIRDILDILPGRLAATSEEGRAWEGLHARARAALRALFEAAHPQAELAAASDGVLQVRRDNLLCRLPSGEVQSMQWAFDEPVLLMRADMAGPIQIPKDVHQAVLAMQNAQYVHDDNIDRIKSRLRFGVLPGIRTVAELHEVFPEMRDWAPRPDADRLARVKREASALRASVSAAG